MSDSEHNIDIDQYDELPTAAELSDSYASYTDFTVLFDHIVKVVSTFNMF